MSGYDDLIPSAAPTASAPAAFAAGEATDYSDLLPPAQSNAATTGAASNPPDQGRGDAFLRGFANAGSFGVGKWANALVNATTAQFHPTSDVGQAFQGDAKGEDFWHDVITSVKGQKQDNASAMQNHPGYYLAGSIAPAVVAGGAGLAGAAEGGVAASASIAQKVGTGAAVGAFTGATESTSGKELASNVATGAVAGTVLSAVPAAAGSLINMVGKKGAINALDSAIADVKSGDDKLSQAALAKLHGLFAKKGSTSWSEQDLLDAAGEAKKVIKDGSMDAIHKAQVAGPTISRLGPTKTDLAKDALNTAWQAAPGAIAGHFMGGGGVGASALAGLGTSIYGGAAKQLGKDVTQYGTNKLAGSTMFQSALATSPYSLGAAAGQGSNQLGLSGVLGQYIDQTWRK